LRMLECSVCDARRAIANAKVLSWHPMVSCVALVCGHNVHAKYIGDATQWSPCDCNGPVLH
jgi:hypothetical protein